MFKYFKTSTTSCHKNFKVALFRATNCEISTKTYNNMGHNEATLHR